MKFLLRTLFVGLTIFVLSNNTGLVSVRSWQAALIAAFVLAIINAVIRPVVLILTLPINLLSLGLFTLVVNGLMVYLADSLLAGFNTSGLMSAIILSVIISVASTVFSWFVSDD